MDLASLFGDDARFDAGDLELTIRLAGEAVAVLLLRINEQHFSFVDLQPAAAAKGRKVAAVRDAVKRLVAEQAAAAADESGETGSLEMRLFELDQRVREVLEELPVASSAPGPCHCAPLSSAAAAPSSCVLLLIDHMRSKRSYCELIENWAASLSLNGRLFFLGSSAAPSILLFLRGASDSLKRYLQLHRTTPVDVDSTGRKCKEKMMTVVFEGPSYIGADASSDACSSDGFAIVDPAPSATAVAECLIAAGVPRECLAEVPAMRSAAVIASSGAGSGSVPGVVKR